MVQAPGPIHEAKREHFQSRVVPTLAQAEWSPKRRQGRVVPTRCLVPRGDAKWLQRLGLNPSANLPLQPRFRLRPQSAPAAGTPGGVALRCGASYLQALLDPIANPHLGPPLGCTSLQDEAPGKEGFLSVPVLIHELGPG